MGKRVPTTDSVRLVGIPGVLKLRATVSMGQKTKNEHQTVTSMRAHLGTRVPEGTALGKLGGKIRNYSWCCTHHVALWVSPLADRIEKEAKRSHKSVRVNRGMRDNSLPPFHYKHRETYLQVPSSQLTNVG
jgi:hypothetical protein